MCTQCFCFVVISIFEALKCLESPLESGCKSWATLVQFCTRLYAIFVATRVGELAVWDQSKVLRVSANVAEKPRARFSFPELPQSVCTVPATTADRKNKMRKYSARNTYVVGVYEYFQALHICIKGKDNLMLYH